MTYEALLAPAMIVLTAIVVWAIARWQDTDLLRTLRERDRQREEGFAADLAAIKGLLDKSAETENITSRIVTGIAETLIPTLRYLNEDVKDLSARLTEMRRAADDGVDTAGQLIGRAENVDRNIAAALEEVFALRNMAEGVVLEQSSRLKAIDIALDFLSSRVNELATAPRERRIEPPAPPPPAPPPPPSAVAPPATPRVESFLRTPPAAPTPDPPGMDVSVVETITRVVPSPAGPSAGHPSDANADADEAIGADDALALGPSTAEDEDPSLMPEAEREPAEESFSRGG